MAESKALGEQLSEFREGLIRSARWELEASLEKVSFGKAVEFVVQTIDLVSV
jgi:hypothetical protein